MPVLRIILRSRSLCFSLSELNYFRIDEVASVCNRGSSWRTSTGADGRCALTRHHQSFPAHPIYHTGGVPCLLNIHSNINQTFLTLIRDFFLFFLMNCMLVVDCVSLLTDLKWNWMISRIGAVSYLSDLIVWTKHISAICITSLTSTRQ